MRISTSIKLALAVWVVAECVAFSLVVEWIGAPDAILIGVVTSLIGFSLLRRTGSSALSKLRAALDSGSGRVGDGRLFLDETLATVGAVALLLPGFLSDVVGLALAAPLVRDRVAGLLPRRAAGIATEVRGDRPAPRHGPATIDLAPREWHHTDAARPTGEP